MTKSTKARTPRRTKTANATRNAQDYVADALTAAQAALAALGSVPDVDTARVQLCDVVGLLGAAATNLGGAS